MNIEELSRLTEDELRSRANDCLKTFEIDSAMSREHHIAEAQFYLAEIERRRQAQERIENAKIARRDYKLELWVIALIGAEIVLSVFGLWLGSLEGNKQAKVLDELNKSSGATADTLTAVRQAQEASLETQKNTLINIVAMNTALQNELGLNYAVSLEVTYDDTQSHVNLFNKGKTNLFLWGVKLDGQSPVIEREPRIITPGGFYYLDARTLKKELLEKVPKGSQSLVPFDVFVKAANGRKYIAKSYLSVTWENDAIRIATQTASVTPTSW